MILFFDTETTGLYPGSVCQLSYIMQTENESVAKNFFFTVDEVEYGAYMVHGFSVPILRELSGGKRFVDFIDEIEKDFLSADVIIAHNISFDLMFMNKEFERLGRVFPDNNTFCSMKNTTAICRLPKNRGLGYKYPKVSELCERFGVTDHEIRLETERLFKNCKSYHDARFDTTAIYLAVNMGLEISPLDILKSYL